MKGCELNRWKLLCGLGVVLTLLAGCSDDDPSDGDGAAATTTSLPEACQGLDSSGSTTSIPDQCADAIYSQSLDDNGSKEVKELTEEQRIGFGRGICAYAKALALDPTQAPTYSDLIESNAKSWGVSKDAVEEIIDTAGQLCPADLVTVLDLRKDVDATRVDLSVGGTGTATVNYTLPDGTTHEEQITPVWERSLTLRDPIDVQVVARADGDGKVTCSIAVGEKKLQAKDDASNEVTCAATADEIRSASR